MTATPEMIPSDLAVEIGTELSPEQFMAVARAFFGYVQEVGEALSPDGDAPRWTVRVREGSTVLAVEPAPKMAPEVVEAVYSRAEYGIRHLESGEIDEAGLTEPAMKHLRTLSEFVEKSRQRPGPIRFWVRRKPVEVSEDIARVIREDWRVDYNDFGTIEGKLETIQDRGTLQLHVRDVLLRQAVRCYFQETMLEQAFENFRRRVEISGVIHYRKNGTPISIDAAHITPLPDDSELPSAKEVRGLFRLSA
jgi:hypothetical protein